MNEDRTYRAYVEMTFEPDENGYLEWEDEYGMTLEELKEYPSEPRTEEEMKRFFADELYEYLINGNLSCDSIDVERF